MTEQLSVFERNVSHMAKLAVEALPDAHRQRRIDYCQRTGEHGCRLSIDQESGSFAIWWGGEDLVTGRTTALYDEELPEGELVTWSGAPDDLSELLGDEEADDE